MATHLAGETCVACRPGSPPVTQDEIAELKPLIPEWTLIERDGIPRLERTFKFRSYRDALAFTQRVGESAEEQGHHPAIFVEWGRVTVTWWTHAIEGLHRNDFVMAAKTDQIASEFRAKS